VNKASRSFFSKKMSVHSEFFHISSYLFPAATAFLTAVGPFKAAKIIGWIRIAVIRKSIDLVFHALRQVPWWGQFDLDFLKLVGTQFPQLKARLIYERNKMETRIFLVHFLTLIE